MIEVKIGGFGGQGVILMGYILGKAAALYDGKNASFSQSYGPESRGGACASEIIISDDVIDYPHITHADLLVVMSQEAYHRYINMLKPSGILIYDEDLVSIDKTEGIKVYSVPSHRIAESLGKAIVANIVMLGFITAVTNISTKDSMKKSILESVPKGTEKLNERAFMKGYEYGIEKYGMK